MTRSSRAAPGRPIHGLLRFAIGGGVAAFMCLAAQTPYAQQGVDCNGLRAQISALDRESMRSNPYAGAAQRQRADLQRSMAYAHSIGCDRRQFLFFGSPPPPQCGSLDAQIQQMRAGLGQLEASAQGVLNTPQRQQLLASYNAYCRAQRGFFQSLFGGQQPADVQPQAPSASEAPPPVAPGTPKGGAEVLCVRHCDGGFFPINYSPGRSPDTLAAFCKASCPNAEVSVYTRVPGEPIQTAVGLDGKPYMDLPAALKYQKTLDASCSCRAPGASWVDTLAGAEAMLNHDNKDILVTPQKSADMARPTADPQVKASSPSARHKPGTATPDDLEATDAAAASRVPTASSDSSGIATGDVKKGANYPRGEGQTVDETGPDGIKRHVRIVGPPLSPSQ